MQIGEPLCQATNGTTVNDYITGVQQALKQVEGHEVHMIVVLLADDNKTRYDTLKKLLCTSDSGGRRKFVLSSHLPVYKNVYTAVNFSYSLPVRLADDFDRKSWRRKQKLRFYRLEDSSANKLQDGRSLVESQHTY